MSDKPSLHLPRSIESGSNTLDVKYGGSTTTITLTAASYDDAWALAAEMETQLKTIDSGFSCDVLTTGVQGRMRISHASAGYTLYWTGATDLAVLYGYDDAADDVISSSPYNADGDYQAPYSWYSTRPPSEDTFFRRESIGAPKGRRTADGSGYKRLVVSTPRKLRLTFIRLPAELMLTSKAGTGANRNRDFESLWKTWMETSEGKARYYPDSEVTSTYYTVFLEAPTSLMDGLKREEVGTAIYGLTLDLIRAE